MKIDIIRPGLVPSDAAEVSVPMRDGVLLATDVYREDDEPRPVVLVRLPYDKAGAYCFMPKIAAYFNRRGYTAVIQDVRGKFRSGGATEFGINEVDDGYDTIDWIAGQAWCDGNVLMWGDSYFGLTQLAAVVSGHPALKAISPRLTGTKLGWEIEYPDGTRDVETTFRKHYFATWYVDRDAYEWHVDWTARPLLRPFEEFFAALGRRSANFDAEFAEKPPSHRFEGPALARLLAASPIPALVTVGLFDNCAIWSWPDLRELLADERWSRAVHLRLEAIDHENNRFGEPPHGLLEMPELGPVLDPALDFYDAVLAGKTADVPPLHVEICHAGTRTGTSWPPPDARETSWYLDDVEGRPALSEQPGETGDLKWRHEPAQPVPSPNDDPFARLADRRDLQEVATRSDVLHFETETEAAAEAVDFVGPAHVELSISSTVPTTNIHARLLDVGPDGAHWLVAKGQVHVGSVDPGRTVCVDLQPIAYRLRAGHRWGLQLMSSDFPEYVLEPGDGTNPWLAEGFLPSEQTVRLGGPEAARLVLNRW